MGGNRPYTCDPNRKKSNRLFVKAKNKKNN